ncbi:hypothetical protein BDF19DRAFT_435106 [Syncephalis fuscata]|nr:hypothetical protein BDF19DRAFT_435106 [Syncephalis fuscata]
MGRNSCKLLRFIDLDGHWNGRIIGTFLLVSNSQHSNSPNNSQLSHYDRLVYNIGSTNTYKNNSKTILTQYYNSEYKLNYQIIRVLLAPDTDSEMVDDDTKQMTTIASGHITLPNFTKHWTLGFYLIDCNRILIHYNNRLINETLSNNTKNHQRYIRVISLSKGTILSATIQRTDLKN